MTATPQADTHLVTMLQERQDSAFATLYTDYSSSLFNVLFRLVGDYERAEDLLHDAFIKIWTYIHRYDPDQGGLYNWLLSITRNVAMDELRHRKVRLEAATYIHDRSDNDTRPVIKEQLSNEYIYTLLPAQYSQILELVYTHGLTQLEIAQELGLPLGTVKTRCRVGLQKLQQAFRQDIHQYWVN